MSRAAKSTSRLHAGRCAASARASGSRLIERAVYAYHRSEQDAFARVAEALGVCKAEDWPDASSRVRRDREPSKLWFWALRRWPGMWPDTEYKLREQSLARLRGANTRLGYTEK